MVSRASRNSDVASSRQRKERELRRRTIIRAGAEKFYAVRVGAQPGIYRKWSDCLAQITGFPKAKYKSFTTREDAQDFVDGGEGDVPSANKWIGVRVGRVPGVYSTVREAMDQTRDDPHAEYRFFTTKEEAKIYVDATTTPSSQRTKRKLPETSTPQNDRSQISVKKRRNDATPSSAGISQQHRVSSLQPLNDDETEVDVQTPSTSDSGRRVDAGALLDAVQSGQNSRPSESPSDAEQSSAERSSVDRTSSERSAESPVDGMDIDALRSENARLKAEVQRLSRPAADPSPHRSRHHMADAYTVLLACQNIDGSPSDQSSFHPETTVTVHGVYDSDADANLAAMQAFRRYCPDAEHMRIVDLGVTSAYMDETKTTKSICQQRRTPQGELRLCWRDSNGQFGFVMVQRKSFHSIEAMRSVSDLREPHTHKNVEPDVVGASLTSRFCYLVCEHYGSNDKLRQDGGMLAAFSSKDRANAEAEKIFRKHFLKNSSDTILEASEELSADISTNTASLGYGIWKYVQRGRFNFFRRNEHGETKVWVHKFEVR